ncbi:ribosomal RNA processing protein 36 homolog [Lethenteron reissneri]|uniref:ribosomal RNA processing protein 36 homolog n=1 Tax=Lethenteron reissneri TaxID=7753 RepID=UPI002AB6C964|nr:ribosomal RNA processing protein 36 homolog [Lethenteron reissneri]
MPLPGDVSRRAGRGTTPGQSRLPPRGGKPQRGRGRGRGRGLSAPQRRPQNAGPDPRKSSGKRAVAQGSEGQPGGVALAVKQGDEDEKDESSAESDAELADDADQDSGWKREMAEMSLEELQRLRETIGTKEFERRSAGARAGGAGGAPKRSDKNRPVEMSSKRPVGRLRQVISMKKEVVRDPRFDDLSGTFSETIFQSTYSFLDSIRQREKKELEKGLKKVKSSDRKQEMEYLLQRMENQERAKQKQEKRQEAELKAKREARELMLQGHSPFYTKKSELRKQELAEKYQALKKSGKVDKFLSQKRKRNAQRDRRKLPPPKRERSCPGGQE